MKRLVLSLTASVAVFAAGATSVWAGDTKKVLSAYESVSKALAADNFAAVKKASTELSATAKAEGQEEVAKDAEAIANAPDIDAARKKFGSVSAKVIELAKGQEGYYVMTCPMANADWVQSTKKISNPYMGKKMPECGMIKK